MSIPKGIKEEELLNLLYNVSEQFSENFFVDFAEYNFSTDIFEDCVRECLEDYGHIASVNSCNNLILAQIVSHLLFLIFEKKALRFSPLVTDEPSIELEALNSYFVAFSFISFLKHVFKNSNIKNNTALLLSIYNRKIEKDSLAKLYTSTLISNKQNSVKLNKQ